MPSIFENSHSLKFSYDLPLQYTAVSQTSNANISANLKPNLKIIKGMNQGTRWVRLTENTRGKKFLATVTLRSMIRQSWFVDSLVFLLLYVATNTPESFLKIADISATLFQL
jgi:hypothetical protein